MEVNLKDVVPGIGVGLTYTHHHAQIRASARLNHRVTDPQVAVRLEGDKDK